MMKGTWTPFSYAMKNGIEYLVIFNIYGASMMLEVLQAVKEGNAERVFFVGSVFSKRLDIGHQVIVTKTFDQAGIVVIDTDGDILVKQKSEIIELQTKIAREEDIPIAFHTIVSVPAVVHNISSVQEFVRKEEIEGVEMELSTFYHFANKLDMENFAFTHVSDNPEHSLLNQSKEIWELRMEGTRNSGKLIFAIVDALQ